MSDSPLELTYLDYTHVYVFPRECLQWIVDTVKESGIDGLKANKFQTASCVLCLLAWAAGKLKESPGPAPTPDDDGVLVFSDPDISFINECNWDLVEAGTFPVTAEEGIGSGPVINLLIKLLIQYLLTAMDDPDKIEDIIAKVLEWLANRS